MPSIYRCHAYLLGRADVHTRYSYRVVLSPGATTGAVLDAETARLVELDEHRHEGTLCEYIWQ